MSNCETTSGSCETSAQTSCGPSGSACPCGSTSCGGDPINCMMGMWGGSFFQALKAAQTDILKAKIQKAWGPKMDKAADAVLEAMGIKLQSMMAASNAKADLRSKLQHLWNEGSK